MKEVFLEHSLKLLNKEYNYQGDDLDRVTYGLEVIYILFTKISILLILSIIFDCFKETLLFFILLTPLRSVAYGMHAKKSWHCYIFSIIIFIYFPYLFNSFTFNNYQKILISELSIISMLLFSPADTYKRPLINFKHRKKLKILSLIISNIYIFLILSLKENYIVNLLILALCTQSILINPITYKLFNLPYDNYKAYLKNAANLQK